MIKAGNAIASPALVFVLPPVVALAYRFPAANTLS
jgi:hypothetical protein